MSATDTISTLGGPERTETTKTIRAAGLWYLAFLVLSGFGMMWADRQFYVPGDAATTIHNLTGQELLFTAGALSVLAGYVCFLVLANVLYRLLAPTGEDLARLMVIFVVTGVAVAFLNRLVQLSVLPVLDSNGPSAGLGTGTQDAMVMTLFGVHRSGEWLAGFFWGLWLLPLGWLVRRSGLAPTWLGSLLMEGGVAYIVQAGLYFLAPRAFAASEWVFSGALAIPEVTFIVWLLARGFLGRSTRSRLASRLHGSEMVA